MDRRDNHRHGRLMRSVRGDAEPAGDVAAVSERAVPARQAGQERAAADLPHGDAAARVRRALRGLHWQAASWLFVLTAIGVVQIVRQQWFDATVFFVAAFGVALSAQHDHPDAPPFRVGRAWLAAVAGVIGAAMCFLPRHSPVMQALVVGAGVAAIALAWGGVAIAAPERMTAFGAGIRRLALAWTIILIAGCVWELIQFILGLVQPTATWFALSDLLNPAVATTPGKIAFVVAWVAGGVWLLRRGGDR